MDLRIIIVSWNVRDRLRECLRSVFVTTVGSPLQFEVFIVDNASHDGSAEMVAREFPQVHLIANAENRGFAAANNQVIQESGIRNQESGKPDFFLLLNPDMRVMPGTLEGIVAFMREPRNARVGIAGCHLVNERGETVPHVRRFPRIGDQFVTLTKLGKIAPRLLDHYLVRDFDYSREARVDSIRGSFFCIRQEVIRQRPREIDAMRSAGPSSEPSRTRAYGEGAAQGSASPEGPQLREASSARSQELRTARDLPRPIGLLDERFFIWFEEVDFCIRTRRAGWQVAYTPSARALDYVGQSFKQVRLYPKQRMLSESMVKYFRKHRPWWEFVVLAVVRPFVLAAAWAYDKVKGKR